MGVKKNLWGIGSDFTEGLRQGMLCPTPGKRIRSGGKGRGLARGRGRGPMGTPGRGTGRRSGLGFGDFQNLGR